MERTTQYINFNGFDDEELLKLYADKAYRTFIFEENDSIVFPKLKKELNRRGLQNTECKHSDM